MDAIKKFKSHLKSGNSGFSLLPFASTKDDSAISAVAWNAKGVATRFRIHGSTHGYDFFYDAMTDAITGADGVPVPESAISPAKYQDTDKNSEAVAGAGHTLSTHEQLDAILRPGPTTTKQISEDKAAKNRAKYLADREAGAKAADKMMKDQEKRTKKAVDESLGVLDAIEDARPEQSAQFIVEDNAEDDPEVIKALPPHLRPGAFGIKDQNIYPEPLVDPTLSHLGPQFIEGEELPRGPAKELVQSLAFNAMVGVPAGRHTVINSDQATFKNGVWVDDSYGDGSEVHYHAHPEPLMTDPNTGRMTLKVQGFDVVVPHLVGRSMKEHTYSRKQQVKTGIDSSGNPYGSVTHLTHTVTMSDADGQDYVSKPVSHEVGERSGENERNAPTSSRDVQAMGIARSRGIFKWYDDKAYRVNQLYRTIMYGTSLTPSRRGGVREKQTRSGAGLYGEIDQILKAPYAVQMGLLENMRAQMGAVHPESLKPGAEVTEDKGAMTPGTLGHAMDLPPKLRRWPHPSSMNPDTVAHVMENIAFLRAQQEIVPPEETKDHLLRTYGEQLHPENFGSGRKGFVYAPKEEGSIHHQQYVENEYGRMLGMARRIMGRPHRYPNHIETAEDFMEAHLDVFPVEPGDSGGVDFLNPIRRDVRSQIAAGGRVADEDEPVPETPSKAGRKAWTVLPHDTKIDQVHGGNFKTYHRVGGKNVEGVHQLDEGKHSAVFEAGTVGELHAALQSIRVPNPVRSRSWRNPEGVSPFNASIHATLEGASGPVIISRGKPEAGSTIPTYRINAQEEVRKSTTAWAIYHPPTKSVIQTKRGMVQTFPSQSAAVTHVQARQEQGEAPGHILIPLHRNTLHPIADDKPPNFRSKSGMPLRVVGKSVREIAWGPGFHEDGIIAIRKARQERDQRISASSGAYSLLGSIFPEVGGARSATRTPPNEQGEIPRSSPVK